MRLDLGLVKQVDELFNWAQQGWLLSPRPGGKSVVTAVAAGKGKNGKGKEFLIGHRWLLNKASLKATIWATVDVEMATGRGGSPWGW